MFFYKPAQVARQHVMIVQAAGSLHKQYHVSSQPGSEELEQNSGTERPFILLLCLLHLDDLAQIYVTRAQPKADEADGHILS